MFSERTLDLPEPCSGTFIRASFRQPWHMSSIASAGWVLGARYVLEEQIAVGGMGQVWNAIDEVLQRNVAVKLLRSDLIESDDFRRRFRAEARLAAGLSHPGIAHVYDYAEEVRDGQCVAFLVMELVDGHPLSDLLAKHEPSSVGQIVSILRQTAEALGAAHDLGIVHRDVKPGNLMITPDARVKVTDFGIARAIDSADITEVGQVIGTARYMSPEQARGEEATPASDVYSLAVIGYEMLAGRTPFAGDTPVAIALAQVQSAPPELPACVPDELRSLIGRSLAKLPEQRPKDGAVLASELSRIAIGPALSTVAPSTSIDGARPRQPARAGDMQPTAVFQHPTTRIEQLPIADDAATEIATAVPSPTDAPLLDEGWIGAERRRRRVAGWGAALAVAACLLFLIAISRADRDNLSAALASTSDPTVTTTLVTAAPPAVVTIDPAAYLGHPEAEARHGADDGWVVRGHDHRPQHA